MSHPLRASVAYDSHVRAGGVFREKSGWQRVDYFESNASLGDPTKRPQGPTSAAWSPAIEAEHHATRERVGLFDLSSFGKIEVSGPGASPLLEWVCSNRVTRGTGKVTYTQMLNDAGGVVSDVTVSQVADSEFLVVTGTSSLPHDLEWLSSRRAAFDPVTVRDATSGYSCFGLWGPAAREVLSRLTDIDLSSTALPYMTTATGHIGDIPVRLVRVTFVGELGWEIYAPTEYGLGLWEQLTEAITSVGGLRCGYRAIDSLRVEKGYLYLGADLRADRTPVAAGLAKFVAPGKLFLGAEAVRRDAQSLDVLRCFVLEDSWTPLQGGELVCLADGATGTVTTGGIGYTLGSAVGFAYLPSSAVPGAQLSVEIDGTWANARLADQPLYDPAAARIRA